MKKIRSRAFYIGAVLLIAWIAYLLIIHNPRISLWPHKTILQAIFGMDFAYDCASGYVSQAASIIITPSCIGANMFCCAFVMLACMLPVSWRRLPLLLLFSLCFALVISTLRMALSLPFAGRPQGQLIHTILSLFIYFGALMTLYFKAEKWRRKRDAKA